MAWKILIAGGGFGGFHAARRLERKLPAHSAHVTLVTDVNFLTYAPFLPAASGAHLEPRHVVVPLREMLPRTDLRLGRVTGADPQRKVLKVTSPPHFREVELPYDHLVVALGSISRTLPIPGLAEHAIGFKTLAEAIALRNRVVHTLEVAETIDDERERAAHLTYVFVGAGYAGLEALAELQDYSADVMDLYPRCRVTGMRWILVEARDRVMPEIPPELAQFATRELQMRGIEVKTDTTVEEVTAESVRLSTGEVVPTHTCAWTAGVKAHPVVSQLGLPLDRTGRIEVDSYMQVNGFDNVWAVGDAAAVPDPARKGQPCPPTSQHAQRQGKRVADNIAAAIGSGNRRPFTYKTLGVFVDMGRFQAVASTVGLKWRGFPAWFLARGYHIMQVPGLNRKLRLATDSTVGLLFGRDSAELGQIGHPPRLGELEPGRQDGDSFAFVPAGGGEQATGRDRTADREELETGAGGARAGSDSGPAPAPEVAPAPNPATGP
jgi:NADH:ubiquinone reductase (H+-translocating)